MSSVGSRNQYVLVGGGLQASLIALAVRHYQPTATVTILEANARLCGNHTWSFHASDIPESAAGWADSLPTTEWGAYHVQFPHMARRLVSHYRAIASTALESYVRGLTGKSEGSLQAQLATSRSDEPVRSGLHLVCQASVTQLDARQVGTADGRTFAADLVIDCRGQAAASPTRHCGYQKFVGFEFELEEDWPLREPVLMDARVEQRDGFRFLYVLPFERRRVLIEDTRFSDRAELDREECFTEIRGYLARHGVQRYKVIREETGCLPMPFARAALPTGAEPLAGGYAGGWFHAATGYSMPLAMRFAETVARTSPQGAATAIRQLAKRHRPRAIFARTLNRLLFRLVQPDQRWQIFRRFYQVLGDRSLQRFYAHEFSAMDAARIVLGRPPQGLTPLRFLRSFGAQPCLVTG